MSEAKAQLSKLVERVKHSEEVILRRAGKLVAKIVPNRQPRPLRSPGGLKGQVWIADDFDELPPEMQAAFDGEDE